MNPNIRKIGFAVLLLLPLLLPSIVSNQYYIQGILCRIIIYGMLIAALDLIVGYVGEISVGHAGLFAVGAYSVGVLTASRELNADSSMTTFLQLPFGIALIIGVLLSAIAGFVLAFPALRLKGPYLAVVTIAYGLIIYTIINEQEPLTNGTKGITLMPLKFGNFSLNGNNYLYVIYPLLVFVLFVQRNLTKSYWGRSFEALKYSEVAAATCGISKSYYKVWAFTISAAVAGLAGGLFAQLDAYVAPNTFTFNFSVEFLIALIVGGVQSELGNLLGAAVMVIFPDIFSAFNEYRLMIFGVSLLLVLYFLPKGLAGLVAIYRKRFTKDDTADRLEDLKNRADTIDIFDKNTQNASDSALILRGLTMRFGGLTAVDSLDVVVKKGTIHGLIGPNGSGKSTTVNLLTGIYKPFSGEILNFGNDLKDLQTYQRAKKGLARTFQNLQLFSDMTALQNVMVGRHNSFKSSLAAICLGLPSVKKEEQAIETEAFKLLQFVGLEDVAFVESKNLAYGQARFLEIARALASNPQVLLLDEPAAGLTSGEIERMNDLIRKIKSVGVSVLLIEHHMDMIMAVSDEVTVLDFGKKIAEGTPAQIQSNPLVIKAYLGTHETALN